LFADEDLPAKAQRDPVAPAQRSRAAERKARSHTLDDRTPTHSFQSLLAELSAIVRNTCRTKGAAPDSAPFELVTTPNAKQRRALDLLHAIAV
jgi:hypothetical protein